jgi:plastocyanin
LIMPWLTSALAAAAFGLLAVACSTPSLTRTAIVKDITIAEDISPQTVTAHPGDEIRWVNMRREPVEIDVPMLANRDLACRRGFTNWLGQIRESVMLEQNQTVSLCFSNPTQVNYMVRAETTLPGGRDLMPGSVSIVR